MEILCLKDHTLKLLIYKKFLHDRHIINKLICFCVLIPNMTKHYVLSSGDRYVMHKLRQIWQTHIV